MNNEEESMEATLTEDLKTLKDLRITENNLSETWKVLLEKLQKQHEALHTELQLTRDNMENVSNSIKSNALDFYKITDSKKFKCGVGIRVMQDLNYDDKEAFTWATEHNMCLKLDATAFKKVAKIQELDFVKIEERTIATIPQKIE